MDGTRTRLICIHGHLVPNGLLRGCALSTSQFLRGDTLAVISFPPPLGFFFFFLVVQSMHEQIIVVKDENNIKQWFPWVPSPCAQATVLLPE